MGWSGFPGNRVEPQRAGMTARTCGLWFDIDKVHEVALWRFIKGIPRENPIEFRAEPVNGCVNYKPIAAVEIACLDLEGVLIPEIWINFAQKTGIDELLATTRDIPDYDLLMQQRLDILKQHGLKIEDIQEVIDSLGPLEGAKDFSTG